MSCLPITPTNYGDGMLRLGLTGGIGSGKSTVETVLEQSGVRVIDADQIARDVVEPGKPAWTALVDAFGTAILQPGGALDREYLAAITFPYPANLRRLNSITHGLIGAAILEWIEGIGSQSFAVALPLFRPEHRTIFGLNEVWALEVEPEVAVERLITFRSFSEDDARARIAAQMTNEARAKIVDRVITNNGTLDELQQKVKELVGGRRLGG